MKNLLAAAVLLLILNACVEQKKEMVETRAPKSEVRKDSVLQKPFLWDAANIYFLLTDRFYNGNPENDINFDRTEATGPLRGFMGGDIQGITQKIEEGYFSKLGVNAIWFSPVLEQIHGSTDEGTGNTYAYHGYWTKDWTALDPNFGTKKDLETLVKTAHKHGIRILMDVVLNHTGPVTEDDPVWPEEWVRTSPPCNFSNYEGTTACTLVENLPDIRTETNEAVELPDQLLAKWKEEGRLSQELDELQLFFDRTGYPRAPKYYIIKWLTDYVKQLGIDGFRVDTVKHVDELAWGELYTQATKAFDNWKKMHPEKVLDDTPFFMVGEVYGYGISSGRDYNFGDTTVDYYANGFHSLINFELKTDAQKDYESIFKKYHQLLHTKLVNQGVVNYLSSHDDGNPFDRERTNPKKAANILLLTPGASQIYYGDETARSLSMDGTDDNPVIGDANLRSFMNWDELDSLPQKKDILSYWQKLGSFRNNHLAVGAGRHKRLSKTPYVFSRFYVKDNVKDKVVIGLDLPKGKKSLTVKGFFGDGTKLRDAYSNTELIVENGQITLDNEYEVALLELAQ